MDRPEFGSEPFALRRTHVVIVVDDEREILSSVQRLLRDEPYTLLVTESPDEALAWVGAQNVSLVISDHRMPTMLGTDLLEAVVERSPTTSCVLLTGYPGVTAPSRVAEEGSHRLLYKPWEPEELRRMIRSILQERENG